MCRISSFDFSPLWATGDWGTFREFSVDDRAVTLALAFCVLGTLATGALLFLDVLSEEEDFPHSALFVVQGHSLLDATHDYASFPFTRR